MPTYETSIDDKPKKIELTKTSEKRFSAKIDDKTYDVEISSSELESETQFSIKIGDKLYRIEMPKIVLDKPLQLKVDEATFKAEVKIPVTKTARTAFTPTLVSAPSKRVALRNQVAEGAVTAPMAGKVIKIKVRKGDQVKQNQVLCIIEAMKMENEISSSKVGTVQEVNVSEGASVSEGEVLFVVA